MEELDENFSESEEWGQDKESQKHICRMIRKKEKRGKLSKTKNKKFRTPPPPLCFSETRPRAKRRGQNIFFLIKGLCMILINGVRF